MRQLLLASGGTPSQAIAYFAARLASRSTLVSVMGRVLGPICDRRGVEQGGIPSNRLFQLITDPELKTLNSLGLGVKVGPLTVTRLKIMITK